MKDAYTRRATHESGLRYSLLIDSMPYGDMPQLSVEQINRILNYALSTKALKGHMKLMDNSMLVRFPLLRSITHSDSNPTALTLPPSVSHRGVRGRLVTVRLRHCIQSLPPGLVHACLSNRHQSPVSTHEPASLTAYHLANHNLTSAAQHGCFGI